MNDKKLINLPICILFCTVVYYILIQACNPGIGVSQFVNPIPLNAYIFIESDNNRYVIDEVYVTFGGGIWFHVVRKGIKLNFDIKSMEKPYKYFRRCDIKQLKEDGGLIQKIKEVEQSYNKSFFEFEITSLKIPKELELKKVKKYSQAFNQALEWILEKVLRWNDFTNGYLSHKLRNIEDILQLKVEIQCILNSIDGNRSRSENLVRFNEDEVYEEVGKRFTSRMLYWTWDDIISFSVLHQIRKSMEIIAEKVKILYFIDPLKKQIQLRKRFMILTTYMPSTDYRSMATINRKPTGKFNNPQLRTPSIHPLVTPPIYNPIVDHRVVNVLNKPPI